MTRRRLLRQLTAIAAASLWAGARPRSAAAASASDSLRAHDAAGLRVLRGPWPTPDLLSPGVHFESIRIRMPDGVHLGALLYLPATMSGRVPALLHTVPYRHSPDMGTYLPLGYYALRGYS